MLEIDKKYIGISSKGYEQAIKEYPVIKELEDFINNYNDFMESEYNSCECEGEEMFKKIFYLINNNYKAMWEEFRFGLAHINIGSYQNPFDDIKYTDLENVNRLFKSIEQRYIKEVKE